MNDVKYPELPKAEGAFETTDDGRWVEAPAGADSARLTPLYSDDQMRSYADATCALRGADEARQFPDNTCPASRHAQMIGEALVKGEAFPQLSEEPEHCGQSILATVEALYKARTALRGAQKESHAAPGAPQQEASGAEVLPTVPDDVTACINAYGDSRADNDSLSGLRIGELVLALRRWGRSLASRAAATAPADPYIPLMTEQAMTIDRKLLRSAMVWHGISWGEDSDEAFACRLAWHVNNLTRAIDAKRREATAPAGGVTPAAIAEAAGSKYAPVLQWLESIGIAATLNQSLPALQVIVAALTTAARAAEPERIPDYCTDPDNCTRCKTHPDHRGDMEHAGIGKRPPWPPTGTSKEGSE